MLNPAGTTPVLVEEGAPPVPGAGDHRRIPRRDRAAATARAARGCCRAKPADARRGAPADELVQRQVLRRGERPAGHGARLQALHTGRAGRRPARYRDACGRRAAIFGIIWAISAGSCARRDWLAGDRLTYADLAAAAHLSAVDYLGDVPWNEDETAKAWYARIKSRPSFRTLLGETLRRRRRRRRATPTSTSDAGRGSRARSPQPRARMASTPSASTRPDAIPRAAASGCAHSSPPAHMATWTGWRRTPTGAAIRARCGRRCARSSCSASTTARTTIRWRS